MKSTTKRNYWVRFQEGLIDLWIGPYSTISLANSATMDPNIRAAVAALHDDAFGPVGWSIVDGAGTKTPVTP